LCVFVLFKYKIGKRYSAGATTYLRKCLYTFVYNPPPPPPNNGHQFSTQFFRLGRQLLHVCAYIYIYYSASASVQGINGKLVLWKAAGNLTPPVKPMIERSSTSRCYRQAHQIGNLLKRDKISLLQATLLR
jgi:hypothetical protein